MTEFSANTGWKLYAGQAASVKAALAAVSSGSVWAEAEALELEAPLDEAEALSFSRALNDVRLVLSARLGIEDEQSAARVHSVDDWKHALDEESAMALLYNFTSWFLETLMDQMLRGLPEDGREDVPGLEGPDAGEDTR